MILFYFDMTRKTRNSKRVMKCANRARKISRNVLLEELCKGMYKAYQSNGDRLPYRHLSKLLEEVKPDNKWLTRNMLNKAFMRYKSKMAVEDEAIDEGIPLKIRVESTTGSLLSNLSNVSSTISSQSKAIGRPVGTTILQKKSDEIKLIDAKNEITEIYHKKKVEAAKKSS